jgi:hypothetical protein
MSFPKRRFASTASVPPRPTCRWREPTLTPRLVSPPTVGPRYEVRVGCRSRWSRLRSSSFAATRRRQSRASPLASDVGWGSAALTGASPPSETMGKLVFDRISVEESSFGSWARRRRRRVRTDGSQSAPLGSALIAVTTEHVSPVGTYVIPYAGSVPSVRGCRARRGPLDRGVEHLAGGVAGSPSPRAGSPGPRP